MATGIAQLKGASSKASWLPNPLSSNNNYLCQGSCLCFLYFACMYIKNNFLTLLQSHFWKFCFVQIDIPRFRIFRHSASYDIPSFRWSTDPPFYSSTFHRGVKFLSGLHAVPKDRLLTFICTPDNDDRTELLGKMVERWNSTVPPFHRSIISPLPFHRSTFLPFHPSTALPFSVPSFCCITQGPEYAAFLL